MKKVAFVTVFLPLCGLWFIGQGSYIHTKAIVAQILLKAAWSETLQGQKEVKPWPWADTWPVGRLSVPRLGIDRIVLAGTSGQSLAFGPGHLFGSAMPGEAGNIVIAGHRDTHFRFLKDLVIGDTIELQTAGGVTLVYRVGQTLGTDKNDTALLAKDTGRYLTLITCYPFDAVRPGGPLRYIVQGQYRVSKHTTAI